MLREAVLHGRYVVPRSRADRLALERRVERGLLLSPIKGCYVDSARYGELSLRGRALAAIRTLAELHPQWVFCSYSAALLFGLQIPYAFLDKVHIAVGGHQSRRRCPNSLQFHVVEGDGPVTVQGILATTLQRTLLDCACQAPFRYGLAIVDSALHWELVSRSELEAYFRLHGKGRMGIKTAREVLRWCDGRSENGGESVARATIIKLGFMVPELQVEVTDPMNPNTTSRVDMFWRLPDGRVIIGELDGMQKYRQAAAGPDDMGVISALARERRREARLNLTGATVIRFSYAEAEDPNYMFRLLSRAGVPLVRRSRFDKRDI